MDPGALHTIYACPVRCLRRPPDWQRRGGLLSEDTMMAQWNVGDLVMFKSGGPQMTVRTIKGDGNVYCEWFDDKKQPQGRAFAPDQLKSPAETGPGTISRG